MHRQLVVVLLDLGLTSNALLTYMGLGLARVRSSQGQAPGQARWPGLCWAQGASPSVDQPWVSRTPGITIRKMALGQVKGVEPGISPTAPHPHLEVTL